MHRNTEKKSYKKCTRILKISNNALRKCINDFDFEKKLNEKKSLKIAMYLYRILFISNFIVW